MDALYGNFLGQLSQLGTQSETEYKIVAEQRQQLELLQKQCNALQKKMRKEKQFNLQLEMNRELKELREKIEDVRQKTLDRRR